MPIWCLGFQFLFPSSVVSSNTTLNGHYLLTPKNNQVFRQNNEEQIFNDLSQKYESYLYCTFTCVVAKLDTPIEYIHLYVHWFTRIKLPMTHRHIVLTICTDGHLPGTPRVVFIFYQPEHYLEEIWVHNEWILYGCNRKVWEFSFVLCRWENKTSMHSRKMRTVRFGGHCEQNDWQTGEKTWPCPILRLRSVNIFAPSMF